MSLIHALRLLTAKTVRIQNYIGSTLKVITAMIDKLGIGGDINTMFKPQACTISNKEDIAPAKRLELSNNVIHSPTMSLYHVIIF